MQKQDRTGKTTCNIEGYKMTIIRYENAHDIDIQFDDGTIVTHKRYDHFKNKSIRHPNTKQSAYVVNSVKQKQKRYREQYLQQMAVMHCGETCQITEYQNSKHITVTFQKTGSIVHTTLKNFKNRTIQDPNMPNTQLLQNKQTRTGQTKQAACGLQMTITDYQNERNIEITFEDGTICKQQCYQNFSNDTVVHPLYPAKNHTRNTKPVQIEHILRKKIAYKTNLPYYYCTCQICGKSDILNWEEIKEHNLSHTPSD